MIVCASTGKASSPDLSTISIHAQIILYFSGQFLLSPLAHYPKQRIAKSHHPPGAPSL